MHRLNGATILLAVVLAACGESQLTSNASLAKLSIHDTLIDCAGAIAAAGKIDPLAEPSTGTREGNALWTVLALMDKEPGLFGRAGRQAAAQSRIVWQMKSAPEQTACAAECMVRFGGG